MALTLVSLRSVALCLLALAGDSFVLRILAAQQTGQQGLEQRQTVQQAVSKFLRCVQSRNVDCIANLTSAHGLYLGVDGPLISRQVFKRKLNSERNLRCVFWGEGCGSRVLKACALVTILSRSTISIDYTRPALYKHDWQVEATLKNPARECTQVVPITWTLEDGYWRIGAIPYI